MVDPDSPLRSIMDGKSAGALAKRELSTVQDLLDFTPRAYLDPTRPTNFATLQEGEHVVILADVSSAVTRPMRNRRGSMLLATIEDGTGNTLTLTFFSKYGHEKALVPGRRILVSGTVSSYRQEMQLAHPEYSLLHGSSEVRQDYAEGPIPVYPAVPRMTSMKVAAAVELALHALGEMADPIPVEVRARHGLPPLSRAYRMVHQPRSDQEHRKARWRFKWQEAFVTQAALAQRRRSARAMPSVPRLPVEGGLAEEFRRQLPFELTPGQEQVLTEISSDLACAEPMHRLLQGEVGSGKTVVALLGMLTVIDSGGQAALLAPTEVLAAQHHRSISELLGPMAEAGLLGGAERATRVALLTGSQSAADRRANLLLAASGEAGIVVGTHALIQEHVQFAELGMVVVDEQHRFGVEQRDALRAKAADSPHVLVMTATPIPRTVAMTVFGDMETSTLTELPQGRQPITTHVVTDKPGWVQRTWERVAEEVGRGGQVYVVCPRIGEETDPDLPEGAEVGPGGPIPSDPEETGSPLHGVLQVERALRELSATRDLRIGLLHGRQHSEEKEAVMGAFAAGQIDVLVATTVIEVGVDVANATQMVVLDADRFGISQLHQLRGRIGRGGKPGLCLLVSQSVDGPGVERLEAVAATIDGFELAQLDLEQRREGDVLGAAQSGGRSTLRYLRLSRDEELIGQARQDAWQVVGADPELADHAALRAAVARIEDERAAFLERG